MIEGMGRAELRRRVAGTVVVVGAAAATLAGCGGTSNAPFVARLCASARSSADLTLVLSNVLPPPEAQATRGDQVEVVSGYHGNQMSLPVAHPAGAVCEVSQGHAAHGDAVVVYKVLRPALIRFVSGLAHPTGAADPAMVGRLVVSR